MKILTLPNILTLLRIAVIPIILILYYLPNWSGHLFAAVIFALACITDWLDGYLARNLKLATRFGEFLDPVADKVMVCVVLILVVGEPQFKFIFFPHVSFTVPAIVLTLPAAIIVSREIIVSALREWMAEIGKRMSVAVSWLGKIKTSIQMLALTVLIFCDAATHASIVLIGYILLYIAALLTIWSMIIYLKTAWPLLRE